MYRGIKKLTVYAAAVIMALLFSVSSFAAVRIEPDRKATLRIQYEKSDYTGIPDAKFEIYRVASVDPQVSFSLTADFSVYTRDINKISKDADWNTAAAELLEYVKAKGITTPYTETTKANGQITFEGLDTGLYLIRGYETGDAYNIYREPKASLVCLPNLNKSTDAWEYSVTIAPKPDIVPIVHDLDIVNITENKKGIGGYVTIWDRNGKEIELNQKLETGYYPDAVEVRWWPDTKDGWTYVPEMKVSWWEQGEDISKPAPHSVTVKGYYSNGKVVTGSSDQIANSYDHPALPRSAEYSNVNILAAAASASTGAAEASTGAAEASTSATEAASSNTDASSSNTDAAGVSESASQKQTQPWTDPQAQPAQHKDFENVWGELSKRFKVTVREGSVDLRLMDVYPYMPRRTLVEVEFKRKSNPTPTKGNSIETYPNYPYGPKETTSPASESSSPVMGVMGVTAEDPFVMGMLPQTGLSWWPAIVLFVLGAAGTVLCIADSRKRNGILAIALLCFIGAAAFTANNFRISNDAAKASEEVVEVMAPQIAENLVSEAATDTYVPTEYAVAAAEEEPLEDGFINIEGIDYIGVIEIPSLELQLPVAKDWSYPTLRKAPARYTGSFGQRNIVIAAHNYDRHFGRIKQLIAGDEVLVSTADGRSIDFEVSETVTVNPGDIDLMVTGDWDMTLFTCTPGGAKRVAVRCRRV